MAGAKSKVTPAVPAEGETLQNTAVQESENQQQAVDSTTSPDGQPPADTGEAGNNQVQQELAPQAEQQAAETGETSDNEEQQDPTPVVEQQSTEEPAPANAVAGLFEPNAIEVVAKCESFRRAGRVFTREVSKIRLADLTEDEFKLLYDEPMLAVQLAYLAEED